MEPSRKRSPSSSRGDSKRAWTCARPSAIRVILTALVPAVVDPPGTSWQPLQSMSRLRRLTTASPRFRQGDYFCTVLVVRVLASPSGGHPLLRFLPRRHRHAPTPLCILLHRFGPPHGLH